MSQDAIRGRYRQCCRQISMAMGIIDGAIFTIQDGTDNHDRIGLAGDVLIEAANKLEALAGAIREDTKHGE